MTPYRVCFLVTLIISLIMFFISVNMNYSLLIRLPLEFYFIILSIISGTSFIKGGDNVD